MNPHVGWRSRTPATSREARRAPRRLGHPSASRLGGLGSVASDYTASLKANLQGQISAEGSTWLAQNTSVDVTNNYTASGASSAGKLITGGFDPTNANDRQALVATIAGGLALIPAVGPVLAASLEALYQLAQPIACPVASFFHAVGISASDCDTPPCQINGPPPTVQMLQQSFPSPPLSTIPGSFPQLVWGALLTNEASILNCKSGVPPEVIVDAIVNIWNATHFAGDTTQVYVPPLVPAPFIIPTWTTVQNSATGNVDPVFFYAFAPAPFCPWGSDLSQAPQVAPLPVPGTFIGDQWITASPARYVTINTGALALPMRPVQHIGPRGTFADPGQPGMTPAGAPSTNAGSAAVKGAAGAAAGIGVVGLVAAAVTSYVVGRPVSYVLDRAWARVKKGL